MLFGGMNKRVRTPLSLKVRLIWSLEPTHPTPSSSSDSINVDKSAKSIMSGFEGRFKADKDDIIIV